MDVGDWLRSLRLGQYQDAFRENEIDDEILPTLTAQDLKELGVAILAHRRKMLTAMVRFPVASVAVGDSRKSPTAGATRPSPTDGFAEHRQLTAMFCDLVGSTGLSARLDPEDMREVIRIYQDACSGAVARYDGFVAKFNGRRRSRLFRLSARPRRGRRTGGPSGAGHRSSLREAETRARQALKVRIGIATGIVVVGLVGTGSTLEQAVIGDTPNLAVRLQARAEPGSVLVAEATRRLLGRAFELARLRGYVVGRTGFTIFLVS